MGEVVKSPVDILIEMRVKIEFAERAYDEFEASLLEPGLDAQEFAFRSLEGQRIGVRYQTLREVWEMMTGAPWQRSKPR